MDVFGDVSKIVFRGRRDTFATFSEHALDLSAAGAALWTCPAPLFVAGAALQTCRVACFSQIALQSANFVAGVAFCEM